MKQTLNIRGLPVHLVLGVVILLLAFHSTACPQSIDFSDDTIKEPIDVKFWQRYLERNPQAGIEIIHEFWGDHVIFHCPVSFTHTTFNSTCDFSRTTFDSTADFCMVSFDSTADFSGAFFRSTADFSGATFGSTAKFGMVTFDSTADFSGASFRSTADFTRATFDSPADFGQATFGSTAVFTGATFGSTADFWMVTFDSTVSFWRATFGTFAGFSRARFRGDVVFWRDTLPDILDFSLVTHIAREIDFTLAKPARTGRCEIDLLGTDIKKIKLNMELFQLLFADKIDLGAGPRGTTPDQEAGVYEQVLKKLKDDGFMQSYQILDIDYHKFKAQHGNAIERSISGSNQLWWNYGYAKWRVIFLWAPGFWILFSVINLFAYRRLSEGVYAIPFLQKVQGGSGPRAKILWYHILRVVAYTGIVFFGLKMDLEKFKPGAVRLHPGLFAYLMLVYTTGIVCLGFIVNITFTK